MDIPKILRRLLALRRMAKGQEGTPEGDNAAHHANAWADKHGLDIPEEALETNEKLIEFEHYWEYELIVYIGQMLDLDTYKMKSGEVRFTGIQVVIDEAMSLYKHHHKPLERIINFAMVGYIFGAMPDGIDKTVEFKHLYEEAREFPETHRISKEDLEDPSAIEKVIATAAGKAGEKESMPLWESLMTKQVAKERDG
jgi:hypothetical protein